MVHELQYILGRMNPQPHRSSSHAVFQLRLHIVLVTKYRRKTLSPELLDYLRQAFGEVLGEWRCELLEFGGEADHVHLLADIHPALNISTLINNLKTASARRCGARFREHLAGFYKKPAFWHRAYFVSSVGGVTLDVVKRYLQNQGTTDKPGRRPKSLEALAGRESLVR